MAGPIQDMRSAPRRGVAVIGAVVVLAGIVVPLALLALGGPLWITGAGLLILLGSVTVRSEIVRLPHLLNRQTR